MESSVLANETWQLRHFGAPPTIDKSSTIIRLQPEGQVSVGRGPKADCFLDSLIYVRLISRIHAIITGERLPNGHIRFTITNKGLNGTYINDFKLGVTENSSQVLHEGDKVAFGHINSGSIKVGEYAPQSHSEFQYLLERVKSAEELPPHFENVETNPFFSPYPSETPVYSNNPDNSATPDEYEEQYNPSSPRSTDYISEKENEILQQSSAVHSFDLEDLPVEEKPSHLNLLVKPDKQLGEENEEWTKDFKRSDSHFSQSHRKNIFEINSVKKSSPSKSLPDVIPESVKDIAGFHRDVTKDIKCHSLQTPSVEDEKKFHSSCLAKDVKIENDSELYSSSCSSCVEDNNFAVSNKVIYTNGYKDVDKQSQNSLPYMSRKKKYILGMSNDGLQTNSNMKSKKGMEDDCVEVGNVTTLEHWNDLEYSQENCDSSKSNHSFRDEDSSILFEKNKNNEEYELDKIQSSIKTNIENPKSENRQIVDKDLTDPIKIKSKRDRDKSNDQYDTMSVVRLGTLHEETLEMKERHTDVVKSKKRDLKSDDDSVAVLSSENQCHPPPPKQYRSSSPIVVIEKMPDNIEGKLWTHLKSKENYSKLKTQSSKSKSAKKHLHYCRRHHHHLDHNVHIKQSTSSHLHSPVMSSRSSSSGKAFKSSHMDGTYSRHKKAKSRHTTHHNHSATPSTTEQNGHTSSNSKSRSKNQDIPLNCSDTDSELSSSPSTSTCTFTKNTRLPKEVALYSTIIHTGQDSSSPHHPKEIRTLSSLPPKSKDSKKEKIHPSRREVRVLSTGFLSSDLNSDEEEEKDDPPILKSDIVKRIYSPSRISKKDDKEGKNVGHAKDKSRDKKCDVHSKNVSERNASESSKSEVPIGKSVVKECSMDVKMKNFNPVNNSHNENVRIIRDPNEKNISSPSKKTLKNQPATKRGHGSVTKDKSDQLASSTRSQSTSSTSTISSSSLSHSSYSLLSSSSSTKTLTNNISITKTGTNNSNSETRTNDNSNTKSLTNTSNAITLTNDNSNSKTLTDSSTDKTLTNDNSNTKTLTDSSNTKTLTNDNSDIKTRTNSSNTKTLVNDNSNTKTLTNKSTANTLTNNVSNTKIVTKNVSNAQTLTNGIFNAKTIIKHGSNKFTSSSKSTNDEKIKTKHSQPSPNKNSQNDEYESKSHNTHQPSAFPLVHKKTDNMKINNGSDATPLRSKKERLLNSRIEKEIEIKDNETASKTKSNSGSAKDVSSQKPSRDLWDSPRKIKEENQLHKQSSMCESVKSEKLLKTSSSVSSKKQSSKSINHSKEISSSSTTQVSSQSSLDQKANLKRKRSIEQESTSMKKRDESLAIQKKRIRLKNMSSSLSSLSSDSSTSLSPLSKQLPPNKSKTNKNTSKIENDCSENKKKENNLVSQTKLKKSSSIASCGKSNKTSRKSAPRTHSTEGSKSSNPLQPSKKSETSPRLPNTKSAEQTPTKTNLSSACKESNPENSKAEKKVMGALNSDVKPSKRVLKKQDVVEDITGPKSKKSGNGGRVTRSLNKPGSMRQPPSQAKISKKTAPAPSKSGKKAADSMKKKRKNSKWTRLVDSSGSENENGEQDDSDMDDVDDDEEDWNLDDGVEYCDMPCGAKNCSNPVGPKVDWVMCDQCEGWYHVVCVNTSLKKIQDDGDQFLCGYC